MKKPTTAMSDGTCKSDNPLMAWPEVQPPAYREPKPTMRPPTAKTRNPFIERIASKLNNSAGCKETGAAIPNLLKSLIVAGEMATPISDDKNCFAMNPPTIAPTKNTKFHVCAFQLKSKNFVFFPNPAAAQMVLKLAEKPKDWPKYKRKNMMAAIIAPENHHDQVCVINSLMYVFILV